MRKMKGSHASGMPMLEIVISIGIFTMISVFVLQLFLSANTLESKAKDTSKAVICAENIAEAFKASVSFEEAAALLSLKEEKGMIQKEDEDSYELQVLEENSQGEDSYYVIHYDSNWNVKDEKDTYSTIVIPYEVKGEAGRKTYIDIFVYRLKKYSFGDKENEELYHLRTSIYKPE